MQNIESKVSLIKRLIHDVGNATRTKTGGKDLLYLDQIDDEILKIHTGDEQYEYYEGPTNVIPKFYEVTLPTEGTIVDRDITIDPIQTTIVENASGGNTLII